MKKIFYLVLISILVINLAACSAKTAPIPPTEDTPAVEVTATEVQTPAETAPQETPSSTDPTPSVSSLPWPVEFEEWGVPVIPDAQVTLADNRSSNGNTLTQGVNAIVNIKSLPQESFDAYCTALEEEGFQKSPNSLEGVMWVYDKDVSGGKIEMILMYDADTTTITVNNSSEAAAKETAVGGETDWPDSVKGIPEFTAGTYVETVEIGGGMYAITFHDVSQDDVSSYIELLKNNGFEKQPNVDTDDYSKMDPHMAYSVGLVQDGTTLQIMVVGSSY